MNNQTDLLNISDSPALRRRKLLPWWIKIFIWIFLVFGVIAFIALLFAPFGLKIPMAFYGLQTNDPLSLTGLILIAVFLFKGITAFGLWFEKYWAIWIGLIDSVGGIIICIVALVLQILTKAQNIQPPIEILLLVPYFIKLKSVKRVWLETLL